MPWVKSLLAGVFGLESVVDSGSLRFIVIDGSTVQEPGAKETTYRLHIAIDLINLSVRQAEVSTDKIVTDRLIGATHDRPNETTLQVLQEPGRQARSKSYLWALRAGPPQAPIVMFHYDERRNYEALSNWLSEPLATFNGVIVTDEHKPYQQLTDNTPGIKTRGGCWAQARRSTPRSAYRLGGQVLPRKPAHGIGYRVLGLWR